MVGGRTFDRYNFEVLAKMVERLPGNLNQTPCLWDTAIFLG